MYKEFPDIKIPDDNVVIWRYMDFAKFVSLLDKEALFFVRVDKLSDRFEGFYTIPNVSGILSEFTGPAKDVSRLKLAESKFLRKCTAVSCWHMNERESAAMWRVYLPGDNGVAVRSSFERLRDSLDACPEPVGFGMVEYVDYQIDCISDRSGLAPCVCKRKSYEYERELRAIFYKKPDYRAIFYKTPDDYARDKGFRPIQEVIASFQNHPGLFDEKLGGMYIRVCLDRLVESVYVSPGSPEWYRKVVKSVMDKYEMSKEIRKSRLDDKYDLY